MLLARSRLQPLRLGLRHAYSTATSLPAAGPPLLNKVREDMKAAMRTKDSSRLDVLRGIISEVTNAAKSSKPVTTNGQLISMLRKRVKRSESAAAEFHQAKREDLRGKEVKQISMLEEYLPTNNIGDEDITRTIQEVIGKMRTNGEKLNQGIVMKALVGPEGTFDGQNVDKKDVARLVNGLI